MNSTDANATDRPDAGGGKASEAAEAMARTTALSPPPAGRPIPASRSTKRRAAAQGEARPRRHLGIHHLRNYPGPEHFRGLALQRSGLMQRAAVLSERGAAASSARTGGLYGVADMGPLPPYHGASYATAVNRLGQLVGYTWEGAWPGREAVLWTPGGTDGPPENPQLRGLGNFSGEPADLWRGAQAWGLNNSGQVVGWANGTDYLVDRARACLWQNGTITDLGALMAYGASTARAINDAGLVVGSAETEGGTTYTNEHAFIHDIATGQMSDLGVDSSYGNSINAASQIVGAYYTPDNWHEHALYWDPVNGAWDLHDWVSLGGTSSRAWAINDKGQVVGWATSEDRVWHGFFCDLNSGQVKHIAGESESLATALNNQGLAVGRYKYTGLVDHALIWDVASGAVEDLNERLQDDARPPGDNWWALLEAWGINDAGQICGFGTRVIEGLYVQRGYVLTPNGL
jgi:probable HAF family extracellular repeat protein